MPFHKRLAKKVGGGLLKAGKAFPDRPAEARRLRRRIARSGKAFPEEKIPGYRAFESKVRELLHKARAPDRMFQRMREDLRKAREELEGKTSR